MAEPGSAFRWQSLRTPLDAPISVLVLMVPVSLWASFDWRFSLAKAVVLLASVAIFYGLVAYASSRKRFRTAVASYLTLGLLVAIVCLLGTDWLPKNPFLSRITSHLPRSFRGWPGAEVGFHPNEVAGVLLLFVPLQWALALRLANNGLLLSWYGSALVFSGVVCTSTLVLTQSRGALLGLAVAVVTIAAWRNRRVRLFVIVLCLAVLLAAAIGGLDVVHLTLRRGIARQVLGRSNWDFRVKVWRAAWWGIQDFPFTGMGLGTFRRVARVLYPVAISPPNYDIAHAHNGFLQAALDLGVPGLLAYTGLWSVAAYMVWTSQVRGEDWQRAAALGLGGCMMSSFVFNLLDTVALGAKGGAPWWMMLGLVASLYRLVLSLPTDRGQVSESLLV